MDTNCCPDHELISFAARGSETARAAAMNAPSGMVPVQATGMGGVTPAQAQAQDKLVGLINR